MRRASGSPGSRAQRRAWPLAAAALPIGALALVVVALPGVADGYRRSESEQGVALWWQETSISYVLDEEGSSDLTVEGTFAALRASFASWAEVECDYGPLDPAIVDGGVRAGREVGFDLGGTNENLLIFHPDPADWEHSRTAIAMTLVTHDPYTGRIYDADIEFNDAEFEFRADNLPVLPGSDAQDLSNTATHEIGHVLGLDHSDEREATMWGEAPPGERKKRTLTGDDIEGVCSVRRPDGTGGGSGGDTADVQPGCSCDLAPSPGSAAPIWGLVTLLAALIGGRRLQRWRA